MGGFLHQNFSRGVEQVLSSKEHKELLKIISGNMFPYYAMPYQTKYVKTKNKQEHLLQHILMTGERINSDWFRKIVIPFALKLPIEKMIYARLNLTVNQNKPYACAWHTDFKMTPEEKEKATTAVYYFNTCIYDFFIIFINYLVV